jgi:hypothetical protein
LKVPSRLYEQYAVRFPREAITEDRLRARRAGA